MEIYDLARKMAVVYRMKERILEALFLVAFGTFLLPTLQNDRRAFSTKVQ